MTIERFTIEDFMRASPKNFHAHLVVSRYSKVGRKVPLLKESLRLHGIETLFVRERERCRGIGRRSPLHQFALTAFASCLCVA
jgi:hypothetical protein